MFGNKTIKLKDLIYERFGDYRDPSLFLCAISCNWKCNVFTKNILKIQSQMR